MPRFSQISFDNIKSEIELFLKRTHNRAEVLFSKASPYGQITNVQEELFQFLLKLGINKESRVLQGYDTLVYQNK